MDILHPGDPETLRKVGSLGWTLIKVGGVFFGPMLATSLFKAVAQDLLLVAFLYM